MYCMHHAGAAFVNGCTLARIGEPLHPRRTHFCIHEPQRSEQEKKKNRHDPAGRMEGGWWSGRNFGRRGRERRKRESEKGARSRQRTTMAPIPRYFNVVGRSILRRCFGGASSSPRPDRRIRGHILRIQTTCRPRPQTCLHSIADQSAESTHRVVTPWQERRRTHATVSE